MSFRAHTQEIFKQRTAGARVNAAPGESVADQAAREGWRRRNVLAYQRYPAFSWDWSWRRCILFSTFATLLGIWSGINLGATENWHIGLAIGVGTAMTFIVAMCVGPLAASWVRNRKWPMGREMTGVIAAVILGVAATNVWSRLGNRYINRLVLPPASQARLAADYFGRFHRAASSPLALLGGNVIFLLLSGVLALPSYLAEQRRLIEEAREREVGALQLQKQETDLRLLVLQAQIEPHFLFNTLASLRSLLRQDVARAEAMIDALVEHLRAAMPVFRENKQYSTLSEQLRICSSYLELMRVRLGDRLTYTIDVPEALRNAAFPPLILLTLVENAVKHGVEPKPGRGLIRIDARRELRVDGAHIRVSVTDNGTGLSAGLVHGVGLSNIRAQLAMKYGDRAALSLISGAEGGAVASVDIPESDANETDVSG
jgi:signal transduction histidine kinase